MSNGKRNLLKNINVSCIYKELTPAGNIYGSGNSEQFITGDWRTNRPVWDETKCKQCLLCVPVCPDSSIPVTNSKRIDFDFNHCKGCGICIKVCPFSAIAFDNAKEAIK